MNAAQPAADILTLPLPTEAAAAIRRGQSVQFLDPETGAALPLDAIPVADKDSPGDRADAQPLPTRAEVEARMGQTFSEALREAIAEHEANPDAAIPWEEAQAEVRAEFTRRRAAQSGVRG